MSFEQFAPARDCMYLAALFLGAGIGCVLNYGKKSAARSRPAVITAGLCFFSGGAAALTAAAILSNWMIFTETALYLPLGILAAVLILMFRFPRAAGFPVLIASGIFIVWNGFVFLTFPALGGAGTLRVMSTENGLIRAALDTSSDSPSERKSAAPFSFQSTGEGDVLEFDAHYITYSRAFPLAGGTIRGMVTEIRRGGEVLYTGSGPGRRFIPNSKAPAGRASFISFGRASGGLETRALSPGAAFVMVFEGSALVFR